MFTKTKQIGEANIRRYKTVIDWPKIICWSLGGLVLLGLILQSGS